MQAVEARSDGNKLVSPDGNGICPAPPSGSLPLDAALDVDCRLDSFLPSAKARSYSRVVPGVAGTGRPVFYMVTELQAAALDPEVPLRIRVVAFGTSPGPGAACVPNGPTQTAAALLWDPYPHVAAGTVGYSIFEKDITFLVYSDETGKVGRTLSHFVAVDRSDTSYSALLVKPQSGTSQNIGSTLQVAVEIRNPRDGCSPVPDLT